MARYIRRLQTRPIIARIDRCKAAAVKSRHGRAPEDAFVPGRPHHRQESRRQRRPERYGGPRYVRDGNVITLVPASAGTFRGERGDRPGGRAA